jgi:hypothetical protein
MLKEINNQLLEVICADSKEVISMYDNFASNKNEITMTLSLASYFAERFEDQVLDVVGLLTLTYSEYHNEAALFLFQKQLFLQANLSPLRNEGSGLNPSKAEVSCIMSILGGLRTLCKNRVSQDTDTC